LSADRAVVSGVAPRRRMALGEQPGTAELSPPLVAAARAGHPRQGGMDAGLREYSLSCAGDVVPMWRAEALLPITDA